jgi:uncharacterized protein
MHRRAVSITTARSILMLEMGSGRPAAAQSAFPPPDAIAAARELVTASRAADQLKTLLPLLMQQLKPAIVQGRADVAREYDTIMPHLIESMNARSEAFAEGVATVYARNFTADELRQLTAFYRGPVGQKFLERMPIIAQESLAMGQKFGQDIAGELRSRMIDELRKRGYSI